jgi:hypothetical protein
MFIAEFVQNAKTKADLDKRAFCTAVCIGASTYDRLMTFKKTNASLRHTKDLTTRQRKNLLEALAKIAVFENREFNEFAKLLAEFGLDDLIEPLLAEQWMKAQRALASKRPDRQNSYVTSTYGMLRWSPFSDEGGFFRELLCEVLIALRPQGMITQGVIGDGGYPISRPSIPIVAEDDFAKLTNGLKGGDRKYEAVIGLFNTARRIGGLSFIPVPVLRIGIVAVVLFSDGQPEVSWEELPHTYSLSSIVTLNPPRLYETVAFNGEKLAERALSLREIHGTTYVVCDALMAVEVLKFIPESEPIRILVPDDQEPVPVYSPCFVVDGSNHELANGIEAALRSVLQHCPGRCAQIYTKAILEASRRLKSRPGLPRMVVDDRFDAPPRFYRELELKLRDQAAHAHFLFSRRYDGPNA